MNGGCCVSGCVSVDVVIVNGVVWEEGVLFGGAGGLDWD